ncbi:MAG: hypothetical protein H7210_13780 [Pyrinomonadaceae bacterium]|nr:hypothetical protein [Phycisphaerales bacterium]
MHRRRGAMRLPAWHLTQGSIVTAGLYVVAKLVNYGPIEWYICGLHTIADDPPSRIRRFTTRTG